jgi:hypothetical protein
LNRRPSAPNQIADMGAVPLQRVSVLVEPYFPPLPRELDSGQNCPLVPVIDHGRAPVVVRCRAGRDCGSVPTCSPRRARADSRVAYRQRLYGPAGAATSTCNNEAAGERHDARTTQGEWLSITSRPRRP